MPAPPSGRFLRSARPRCPLVAHAAPGRHLRGVPGGVPRRRDGAHVHRDQCVRQRGHVPALHDRGRPFRRLHGARRAGFGSLHLQPDDRRAFARDRDHGAGRELLRGVRALRRRRGAGLPSCGGRRLPRGVRDGRRAAARPGGAVRLGPQLQRELCDDRGPRFRRAHHRQEHRVLRCLHACGPCGCGRGVRAGDRGRPGRGVRCGERVQRRLLRGFDSLRRPDLPHLGRAHGNLAVRGVRGLAW